MTEAAPSVPFQVGFFLAPNFPMLAFSAAIEALRVANWVSGQPLYDWMLLSEDGKSVSPSSGIAMQPHAAMSDVDRLPIVLFCAGIGGSNYRNRRVLPPLRPPRPTHSPTAPPPPRPSTPSPPRPPPPT